MHDGEEPPDFKKRHVRRTTIILEDDERKYIDAIIEEKKEPGIKQLFSKMLDVYRSMMVYDWKYPGEYYMGISRVAFISIELINLLLSQIPTDQHRTLGRRAGEAARISMETSLNLDPRDKEKWSDVFKRLRVQGLGDFYQRDRYIIVKTPFMNSPEVLRGYLETLIDVGLTTRTMNPPFIYELTPER
ncbi:MAG: hypothetical protein JSV35_06255 [Candidatus Bathyarchaeota archaeon]|nr:MAG: hypothetical protein JSV35_06255 [Candidatus Bathyarchaeota archaeon]